MATQQTRDRWPAVATVGLMLAVAGQATAAVPSPSTPLPKSVMAFEQDGLRVEMDLVALAESRSRVYAFENAELRFAVREAVDGGQPVAGLDPLAWLISRQADEALPDRDQCKYQIRGLLAGRLARIADVNLNQYLLITLDDNNSVSIIDPQIESSKTKTLGMIALTSRGADFVLGSDRRNVLVTLPGQGQVAAADLFVRKARYLDLGGEPREIDLAPDGRLAWVGDAAGNTVSAIDAAAFTRVGAIEVGPGPHRFAFGPDSRLVFVTAPAMSKLAVIDAHEMALVGAIEIGSGTVAMAYSAHSGQVYAARGDGTVVAVGPERKMVTAKVDTGLTIDHFGVAPDGRFAFAVHSDDEQVSIIDLAVHRLVHTVAVGGTPDRVDFTETFAYIRRADSGDMLLIDLGTLVVGSDPLVAPVVMGQQPPARGLSGLIAPVVAPLPEGGGALLLNSADRSIYHFMEGMNAPMGSYRTYPWPARGVLISDRTIRELDRGAYQTELRLPRPGSYTVAFLVPSSPQLYGCLDLTVAQPPNSPLVYRSMTLKPLPDGTVFAAGEPTRLRVRLEDPVSGRPLDGLKDVTLLVHRLPTWQYRALATSIGDGWYEIDVTFPVPGRYMVMARSPERGVELGEISSITAEVVAAPSDAVAVAPTASTPSDAPENPEESK